MDGRVKTIPPILIQIFFPSGPWPFYKMAIKAMNEANKNAECMPLQLNMYLLKWLETYLRQMCAMCENVFGT